MNTPEPNDQWYVLQVLSGKENKVRDRIIRTAKEAELSNLIYRVEVPTELISEIVGGRKKIRRQKKYPGYVYINLFLREEDGTLNKDLWFFIQQTDGVISIVGAKNNPLPLPKKHVEGLLKDLESENEVARPKIEFNLNDTVRINNGPFEAQEGKIVEIDKENGKIRVSVNIFDRAVPVDLEFWQVEKIADTE